MTQRGVDEGTEGSGFSVWLRRNLTKDLWDGPVYEYTCSPSDTPQGPDGVICFREALMRIEPPIKRTISFIDDLRYLNKRVTLPDGTEHAFLTGEEKGIDVRMASRADICKRGLGRG